MPFLLLTDADVVGVEQAEVREFAGGVGGGGGQADAAAKPGKEQGRGGHGDCDQHGAAAVGGDGLTITDAAKFRGSVIADLVG